MTLTFDLPTPPSANRLWRNFQGRTVKSAEYRAWETEAGWAVAQQRLGAPAIRGEAEIVIMIGPLHGLRDADSVIKPLQDLLETQGVITNDRLIRRGRWDCDNSLPRGRCLVTIQPLVRAS